jgi:hypothetical protein
MEGEPASDREVIGRVLALTRPCRLLRLLGSRRRTLAPHPRAGRDTRRELPTAARALATVRAGRDLIPGM